MTSGSAPTPASSANSFQLNDESLAMLLEEVSAMAASGRSLVSGLAGLNDVALGRLGRAVHFVQTRMEQGQSPSVAMASLSSPYQTPIRIAMQIMAETGSTEPIHETVRLIRQREDQRRQVWLSAINPLLNMLVAAVVAFFVLPWILVAISESEPIPSPFAPSVTEICQAFAQNFTFAAVVVICILACFAIWIHWGIRRSIGRAQPSRHLATFCRWLAIQIEIPAANIDTARAIESAAEVAVSNSPGAWKNVATQVRAGATSEHSLEIPPEAPAPIKECVVDLVAGKRDPESIAHDLRKLSELHEQNANQQQSWWLQNVPHWIAWILMIAVIIVLLQTAISPLLHAIGEVPR
ncbi:type II secretion system F family protein [Rhodopirellula sp. P2]|uniref:type II secretion system F family protein n=1 Tax=Rhodopirellula sp. P2 TaxID=2127060 RepID=UPI002367C827|nr:type II secretion system F family protein [Rhodopirellula sp. P2]WDQ16361.1 type II secretion system F family protein [Rhodopirellula sp. P2]